MSTTDTMSQRVTRHTILVLAMGVAACDVIPRPRDEPPWVGVRQSTDAIAVFLDTSRVQDSANFVRATLRFVFPKPQLLPDSSTRPFTRMEATWDVGCRTRTVRDVAVELFDRTGKQIGRHVFAEAPWQSWKRERDSLDVAFRDTCERLAWFRLLRSLSAIR